MASWKTWFVGAFILGAVIYLLGALFTKSWSWGNFVKFSRFGMPVISVPVSNDKNNFKPKYGSRTDVNMMSELVGRGGEAINTTTIGRPMTSGGRR